jgi:hypothetical protein
LRPLYLEYLVEHERAEDLEASDDPARGASAGPEEDPDD